jgi:hypothetical protein
MTTGPSIRAPEYSEPRSIARSCTLSSIAPRVGAVYLTLGVVPQFRISSSDGCASVAGTLMRRRWPSAEGACQQLPQRPRRRLWKRPEVERRAKHIRQRVRDALAVEEARARQHLVHHHAERPDVRALVDQPSGRLLGTHVGGRAHDHARLRHRGRRDRRRHRQARRHRRRGFHRSCEAKESTFTVPSDQGHREVASRAGWGPGPGWRAPRWRVVSNQTTTQGRRRGAEKAPARYLTMAPRALERAARHVTCSRWIAISRWRPRGPRLHTLTRNVRAASLSA